MKRNSAIECIRVLAIFSVVFVHVQNLGMPYSLPAMFIGHLRFAVVFFMVIAGYQWGKKLRAGRAIGHVYAPYSFRILRTFVLWSLVYLIIPRNIQEISQYMQIISHNGALSLLKIPYWRLLDLAGEQGSPLHGVLYILSTGTKYHLWFLTSLVWASTIAAVLVKWRRESWLMWIGIGFYVSGVLLEVSPLSFNMRYGPFFGTIFFAIGWRLSSHRGAFTLKPAIALLSGGLAVHVIELLFLQKHAGFTAVQYFVESTIGVGCVWLALARPSLGAGSHLASWGQYVLGIYLIHPLFIDFFRPSAGYIPSHVRDLAFPAIVFLFSACAVFILQKIDVLKPFVAASRTRERRGQGITLQAGLQPAPADGK